MLIAGFKLLHKIVECSMQLSVKPMKTDGNSSHLFIKRLIGMYTLVR